METKQTPEQKKEAWFERWMNPQGIEFKDPAAKKAYDERVTRFIKVFQLQEPDRVPLILPAGTFPLYHAGITLKEAMEDNRKLCDAYRKFLDEFESDTYAAPMMIPSAKAAEIADTLTSKWPGHGLPDHASMLQFVEGEYMKEDDYDLFLEDLTDFCLRRYIPRSIGALAPFENFPPTPFILGMANKFLTPAIMPQVRAAYQAIIDYGEETARWMGPIMEFNREATARGYPTLFGGQAHAPFDILADTLRGTKGIVKDMYKRPDKILAAMDRVTQMNIDCGMDGVRMTGRPIVFFALHKGDDTFMSPKQYEKFYWPTFRKVILGLIDHGVVPLLFAEGRYDNRLEIIKDLPKGKVVWHFDQTDMFRAKKILGDTACIAGNVPASLLCTATPQKVKEYCRKLIEVCGEGGGFILTGGASVDKCDPDNLHAMTEAVMEYGIY
ncbi:MAG: uroporphyrinogen decarboxylase family protein [Acidobacteriota bacterium]